MGCCCSSHSPENAHTEWSSKVGSTPVPVTLTFGCKGSGYVEASVTLDFFPFQPSTLKLSYHCRMFPLLLRCFAVPCSLLPHSVAYLVCIAIAIGVAGLGHRLLAWPVCDRPVQRQRLGGGTRQDHRQLGWRRHTTPLLHR